MGWQRFLGATLTVVLCLELAACQASKRIRTPSMQSNEPYTRVASIQQAAAKGDASALPHLVDRLDDEDAAVRFAAILALERLTGRRFGYRYGGTQERRGESIARWRRFLESNAPRAEREKGRAVPEFSGERPDVMPPNDGELSATLDAG